MMILTKTTIALSIVALCLIKQAMGQNYLRSKDLTNFHAHRKLPPGEGPPPPPGGPGMGPPPPCPGMGPPGFGPEGAPDFVEASCTTQQLEDFACDLPGGDEPGVFVCRARPDRETGEAGEPHPICIPLDKSVEGDECGCCDGDCPLSPPPGGPGMGPPPPCAGMEPPGFGPEGAPDFVEASCTAQQFEDFACDLPRGDDPGVFVCRAHPDRETGEVGEPHPICIPLDKSVESDECGCCDGDCPQPCPADTCTCELDFVDRDGNPVYGVEVVIVNDGVGTIKCVPEHAAMMMTYHGDNSVTCNYICES